MARELENIKNQRKSLSACLMSGTHKAGWQAAGVSKSTWQRFLSENQDFNREVVNAISKGKLLRGLKYSGQLSKLAFDLAKQRLEDGTASDRLILALLPLQLINSENDLI